MGKLKLFQNVSNIYRRGACLLLIAIIAFASSNSAYAMGTFSNHPISSGYTNPGQVTTADGSLWYLQYISGVAYIGKMTTTGTTTDYNIRTLSGMSSLNVRSLTTGLDGNIWFNANVSTSIYTGVLNISSGSVTIYNSWIPSYGNYGPIITGTDGKLWYYIKSANDNKHYLIYINPSNGSVATADTSDTYSSFTSITSGPDGNIWVTDAYYNRVRSYSIGGSLNSYLVPTANSYPISITSGPDGNLWFVQGANGKITKLTTTGTFTQYTPATGVSAGRLISGPDGAVWFVNGGSTKKIGRITTGGSITEYTIPGTSVMDVNGMTVGPDNAMWFSYKDSVSAKLGRVTVDSFFKASYSISSIYTNPGQITNANGSLWYLESSSGVAHIGKMTTSGATTDYNIRTLSGVSGLNVRSITTGPDGNVWFNGSVSSTIYTGFLDTSTGSVTVYSSLIPSYGNVGPIVAGSDGNLWQYIKSANDNKYYLEYTNPSTGIATTASVSDTYSDFTSITSGPDGNIWVTDGYYNRVRSFSSAGSLNSYVVPTANSYPRNIINGPDGNLWLTEAGKITKLTTGGTFTEYTPAAGVSPGKLSSGPDGAVWFIDGGSTKKIGRISSSGVITEYVIPGISVTGVNGMTLGPDNTMWFTYTDASSAKLGRLFISL